MAAEGRFAPAGATDRILGVTAGRQIRVTDGTGQARGPDPASIAPLRESSGPGAPSRPGAPREIGPPAPDAEASIEAEQLANRSDGAEAVDTTTAPPEPAFKPSPAQAIQPEIGMQLQRNLKRLRLYDGAIDGRIGPMTKVAIQRFQESIGGEPTGDLTPDQMFQLAQAAEGAIAVSDDGSPKPTEKGEPGR